MNFKLLKFHLSIGLLLLLCNSLMAQIDTVIICNPGDPAQLNARTGPYAYEWTPPIYLDNPTIANPIARPDSTTTFIARIIPASLNNNLIINSDFSDGNMGFFSDYPFVEIINIQGVFGINTSANNLNPIFFEDCPDHTTGTGNMMVVDGSPIANEKVWCQTVPVKQATNYAFSAWLTSVNPQNPAGLQFSINDQIIGNLFRAGNQVCEWRQFFEIWNAGTNSEAEICIVNRNTNPQGNDFALDDFAFYELEEVLFDTTVVIVEALEAATQRRAYYPNAFSPNEDGINDLFLPSFGKGVRSLLSLQIFDRWGNLIYESNNCTPNDISCGWDGTFQGQDAKTGVYVYLAQVEFADQTVTIEQGEVLLVE